MVAAQHVQKNVLRIVNDIYVSTVNQTRSTLTYPNMSLDLPWIIVLHISIATRQTIYVDVGMTEYMNTVKIFILDIAEFHYQEQHVRQDIS